VQSKTEGAATAPTNDKELELRTEAVSIAARAAALEVKDEASMRAAAELLLGAKALISKVKEFFEPMKRSAHEAHQAVCARERESLEDPLAVERITKAKLATYEQEQEKIRDAERRRREQEERAKEVDRLLAEAVDLEAAGDKDEAAAIVTRAIEDPPPAPLVTVEKPIVAGVSYRTAFEVEVVDKKALVAAIAAGKCSLAAVDVNVAFLKAQARALGSEFKLPGVVVRTGKVVSARGKA